MSTSDCGVGFFAISRCGHDKGEAYLVVGECDGYCLVANGTNRALDTPKRKNMRHLWITKTRIVDFEKLAGCERVSANAKIARAVKDFAKARCKA